MRAEPSRRLLGGKRPCSHYRSKYRNGEGAFRACARRRALIAAGLACIRHPRNHRRDRAAFVRAFEPRGRPAAMSQPQLPRCQCSAPLAAASDRVRSDDPPLHRPRRARICRARSPRPACRNGRAANMSRCSARRSSSPTASASTTASTSFSSAIRRRQPWPAALRRHGPRRARRRRADEMDRRQSTHLDQRRRRGRRRQPGDPACRSRAA